MHATIVNENHIPDLDISDSLFRCFSNFIYDKCGVFLPHTKKIMLAWLLNMRLRHIGISSLREYYNYVSSPKGLLEELEYMIDVVTTHKTDFFREPHQFDFLKNKALPTLVKSRQITEISKLNIWSAGCSSGEEAYTLCMVLSEFFKKRNGAFAVLATDISKPVLSTAKRGIYSNKDIEPIPYNFQRKYLMQGDNSRTGSYRIVPELRPYITFQCLNLNKGRDFGIKKPMDVIFCRNVIMYFDRPTQEKLFDKFYSQLRPGGYLFLGHSETIYSKNGKFHPVVHSIYRKPMQRLGLHRK